MADIQLGDIMKQKKYSMVILDDVVENIYNADSLNVLFKIAEDKGIVFVLQGYSKRILGTTNDKSVACVITEGMNENQIKTLGVMHYDMVCHIIRLRKRCKEVSKWNYKNNIIYTDEEMHTITLFSRIHSTKLEKVEGLDLLHTMSVDEFIEELSSASGIQ